MISCLCTVCMDFFFWDTKCPSLCHLSSAPCIRKDLLNWMLATACQQGHLEVVKLLVLSYQADAEDCALHSDEFPVITGLPLYAAARAGTLTQNLVWKYRKREYRVNT